MRYEMNRPVDGRVRVKDAFWSPRLRTFSSVTLKDTFDKLEQDGALENYRDLAAGRLGHHRGMPWHDGLLLETIRGAADDLTHTRDEALTDRIDAMAELVEAAQLSSGGGYLSTYTQLDRPSMRFGEGGGSILWQHDLYNNGCLFEAGAHYWRATRHARLLECAVRSANDLSNTIGEPPKKWIVPGHSLPEYALIELIELFEEEKGLAGRLNVAPDIPGWEELARFWIHGRGRHVHRTNHPQYMGEYSQDHAPIEAQFQAVGHAVRAMLYYTGAARLAVHAGDEALLGHAKRLWDNVAERKLYINGGVGAAHFEEKLGTDYELPNTGYMETCASAGLILWAETMSRATGEAKYFAVAERALYNLMLSSVTLEGDRYFYQNPMESDGTHHHWNWHDCPCCPPMIAKIFGQIDRLMLAQDDDGLFVNLLIGGSVSAELGNGEARLTLTTALPWEGCYEARVDRAGGSFLLRVRVPDWAFAPVWRLNGAIVRPALSNGYAVFTVGKGDAVSFEETLRPVCMQAHPQVEADRGLVAVMMGPLVYCAEGIDNPDGVDRPLAAAPGFRQRMDEKLLGGVVTITADTQDGGTMELVPLGVWDNREPGPMRTWFRQEGRAFVWDADGWEGRLYRRTGE